MFCERILSSKPGGKVLLGGKPPGHEEGADAQLQGAARQQRANAGRADPDLRAPPRRHHVCRDTSSNTASAAAAINGSGRQHSPSCECFQQSVALAEMAVPPQTACSQGQAYERSVGICKHLYLGGTSD